MEMFLLLISYLATAEKYALLVGINDYQNDKGESVLYLY